MHSAGMFEDDGAAASASWRWLVNNSATAWMRRYSPTGTLASEFHLNSFLSNGFRITYNATNDSRADIYNYLVVWGTDWTVNSGTFNARTTVGNDTIAHGLGVSPTFVMQISGQGSGDNTNNSSGQVCIGMASSTTIANQRCMAAAVENARNTMDTWRYMPTDSALGILDATTGAIDGLCTISTLDSTNFVDNWSDACSAAWRISWLAVSGGKHDVHGRTAPASVGNQSKTGLSFTPEGLFAFSRGAAGTTTSDVHSLISVGAAKSSSLHRNALYTSEDNTANAEALVRSSSAYLIETSPTAVAPTASSTAVPNMQVELVSFASGQYTVNYDATTGGSVWTGWAFAQTGSTAYNRSVNETVDVSENISRKITVNRPVNESVAVSEAMSRGVGRTVAESVAVSDNVTRQYGANRTANETVSIEENVSRSGSFDRQITDTPINVTENIFRNISVNRAVNESVAVSEQITSSRGYTRTVNESVEVLGELDFDLDDFDIEDFGAVGYEIVSTDSGSGRVVNESVSVSEQVTSNFGKSVFVDESVGVSDSVSRQANFFRTVNESVAVSELVSGGQQTHNFRVVNENVSISESMTGLKPTLHSIGRSIKTSNTEAENIESSSSTGENLEA